VPFHFFQEFRCRIPPLPRFPGPGRLRPSACLFYPSEGGFALDVWIHEDVLNGSLRFSPRRFGVARGTSLL